MDDTEPDKAHEGATVDVIHECFRQRVRENPDAPAVVLGDTRWSYADIDRASDAVARSLAEAGVGPGDIVPVVAGRGAVLNTTLLGVLKTGAAYAALDHRWPPARLRSLTDRLRSGVVVAEEPVADSVDGGDKVCWRTGDWIFPAPADTFASPPVSPDDPAAVFFTSGTSGEPKGVLSPHRATTRLYNPGSFGYFGPGCVMPNATPVPWDGYTLEVWSVLLSGGCSLVIDVDHLYPALLRGVVRKHGVNTIWLTSTLFNVLVDEDCAAFAGMSHVMVGGERLSASHVRSFLTTHPSIRLTNGYGPAENTVFTTTHDIGLTDVDASDIPIGRPVVRTGVHLLDGDRACGPGETGEICAAGDGLALGYLDDPVSTAEAFVDVDIAGARHRVYRTGDLGHRSPDGVLHFDGRSDRQLKVRGHRVEPREVEQCALDHPDVGQAVALADPGRPNRLVLFITSPRAGTASTEAVRDVQAHLRARLPDFLLPSRIVALTELPLNANGKVDQRRLLADTAARPAAAGTGRPHQPS
ncbi:MULTISPECIES: amino acid adenylation domain-containing protein [unclassified Streptomyces]|uniref:amino acid adenylation domain-containing protein n=1 Tax=unclassified Streptomyces TaxID=2593676 RepID=UPI0036EC8BB7